METLVFLLALVAFMFLRQVPKKKRAEMLLRLEYELHKRGFINYKD